MADFELTSPDRVDAGGLEAASSRGSVLRGSSQLFMSRIVGNTGFFVAVLILGRGLPPAERGLFALVTTSAQILARTMNFGVGDAATVLVARDPRRRRTLLTNLLLFTATSTIAAAALMIGIATVVTGALPAHVTRVEVVLLGAAGLVSAVAGVGDSYLIGRGRIATSSTVTAILPWVYALGLGSAWALRGLSVDIALLVWIGAYAGWAAVVIAISARQVGFDRPSVPVLQEMIAFGSRAWIGSLSKLLNYRVDQILLGVIATEAALGYYAVAVNASEVLLQLPSATATALVPILARSASGERLQRTLVTFRILLLIAIIEVVAAAVAGPFLLPVVFGHQYHASIAPFLWLLPGTLGFVASDVFAGALLAQSTPGLSSLASAVALVLGVGLDLLLIPRFGASGAGAAASAAFLAGGITALTAYRRHHRFGLRSLAPGRADLRALIDAARSLASAASRQAPT